MQFLGNYQNTEICSSHTWLKRSENHPDTILQNSHRKCFLKRNLQSPEEKVLPSATKSNMNVVNAFTINL
jgi:hypothetical protein